MPRREVRLLLVLSVLAVGLALGQSVIGLSTGLLFMAPALVMLLPLLGGRYPGEQRLVHSVRTMPAARCAIAVVRMRGHALGRLLPRGGRLLASRLAVRPPPPAPLTR
jgi:hypothetical protein